MSKRARTTLASFASVSLTLAILVALAGCPGTGGPSTPPDNGNGNGGDVPEFGILNFRSNIAFSDDIVLTVLYSVPSTAERTNPRAGRLDQGCTNSAS